MDFSLLIVGAVFVVLLGIYLTKRKAAKALSDLDSQAPYKVEAPQVVAVAPETPVEVVVETAPAKKPRAPRKPRAPKVEVATKPVKAPKAPKATAMTAKETKPKTPRKPRTLKIVK